MSSRGQGGTEYLLLIGGGVLVAAIVIALLLSLINSAEEQTSLNACAGLGKLAQKQSEILGVPLVGAECPYDCCEGLSCYEDKPCTGGLVCDNGSHTCISAVQQPCPPSFSCCLGDATYEPQACAGGLICIANDTCVECIGDADCPAGEVCSATNACVQCVDDSDCSVGEVCSSNVCVPSGPLACPYSCCDALPGYQDLLCSPGLTCDNVTHSCVECIDDTQCSPTGEVCRLSDNTCVQCVDSADCSAGLVCSASNTCVECIDDSQCVASGEVCNVPANTCVECNLDSDCDSWEVCSANVCSAPQNLVAYYQFEEQWPLPPGGINAIEDSAGANDLLVANNAPRVAGRVGQAISLNGTNQHATLFSDLPALDFDGSEPFSVCAWTWLNSTSTQRTIMGKLQSVSGYRGWELSFISSNLSFYIFNSWTGNYILKQASGAAVTGQWRHICVTYNGNPSSTGIAFYINSALTPSVTSNDTLDPGESASNTAPPNIGSRQGSAFFWYGLLDEVRVYDKALSQAEVQAIYNYAG